MLAPSGRGWRPAAAGGTPCSMSFELRRVSTLGACCVCAVSSTACATTTGLAWVHERESGVDLHPPTSHAAEFRREPRVPRWAPGSADFNRSESDPPIAAVQDPPRHRLDHTVTLGGEASTPDRRAETTEPAGGQPVINIYVTSAAPGPAYGAGYGAAYAFGVPLVATTTRNVPMQMATPTLRPGLDWPAVPNPGPPFPYRTGPASPWTGENPRRR
jgi:hypothetical protein